MHRRGLLVACCSALVLGVRAADAQNVPATDIDRIVRAQVDSGFSGVVIVARRDSVLLRRAYGRAPHASAKLFETTSAFWIASITKSVTAAAVLALQEEGLLSVSDSLGRFFPAAPADKRAITLHQLLTHTAGFGTTYTGATFVRRDDAVKALLAQPLAYRPGQGYRYVDDDYELLAAVAEVASGERWEAVIQRRVLDRAGLRHTGFWCSARRGGASLAPPAGSARGECSTAVAPDWAHRGANGMWATADDLLAWAATLQRAGDSASWGTVVTPQVRVRREGRREVWYGYGVRVYTADGARVEVVHSGSGDDGHTAIVRQLRCGVSVVVLSNAGQRGATTWASYVAARIIDSAAAIDHCRADL